MTKKYLQFLISIGVLFSVNCFAVLDVNEIAPTDPEQRALFFEIYEKENVEKATRCDVVDVINIMWSWRITEEMLAAHRNGCLSMQDIEPSVGHNVYRGLMLAMLPFDRKSTVEEELLDVTMLILQSGAYKSSFRPEEESALIGLYQLSKGYNEHSEFKIDYNNAVDILFDAANAGSCEANDILLFLTLDKADGSLNLSKYLNLEVEDLEEKSLFTRLEYRALKCRSAYGFYIAGVEIMSPSDLNNLQVSSDLDYAIESFEVSASMGHIDAVFMLMNIYGKKNSPLFSEKLAGHWFCQLPIALRFLRAFEPFRDGTESLVKLDPFCA